uniref:Uncharacterized protein n=1 Tax=Anopheles melas TaxID=34690 RepID=A0A182UFB4_9DIPT
MVVILIVLPGTCHQHQQPWAQPPAPPAPTKATEPGHQRRARERPPPATHRAAHGRRKPGTRRSARTVRPDEDGDQRRPPSPLLLDANNNHRPADGLRYLSRVIISDDFSQVEVKTAVPDAAEVEAVNREEEIIKKRKTELTTTRQIETRVKRQLLFEDGKVVEDSGPIVSTNTTEDTDKQETVQTEHRTLGDPAEVGEGEPSGNRLAGTGEQSGGPHPQQPASPAVDNVVSGSSSIAPKTTGGTAISVARPPDGLLRNIKEEVVVSREETKERTEVTEQKHFGDFSDDVSMRDPAPTSGSVWKHFNQHIRQLRYFNAAAMFSILNTAQDVIELEQQQPSVWKVSIGING